jgi:DNA-binding CsgD family transcriptional regulator
MTDERADIRLSPRQRQILELIALGRSDKEIAGLLNLAPATVRTYLQRLYGRYGLHNRAEAVAVCLVRTSSIETDVINCDGFPWAAGR